MTRRGLPRSRWVTVSNLSLAAWSERLVRNADRTVRAVDKASRAKLGLLVRTSSSASTWGRDPPVRRSADEPVAPRWDSSVKMVVIGTAGIPLLYLFALIMAVFGVDVAFWAKTDVGG